MILFQKFILKPGNPRLVIEVLVLVLGLRGMGGAIQNEELRKARLTVNLEISRKCPKFQNGLHLPPRDCHNVER